MGFWAAIPIIGTLFEKIGEAIDRNSTTDEERLKFKAELMSLYAPVLVAVLDAQKSLNEMQVKMAEIEAKSEHWMVWARRPIIAFMAVGNFIGASLFGYMDANNAFYFACLANGLDMASRGVEKVVDKLKQREQT